MIAIIDLTMEESWKHAFLGNIQGSRYFWFSSILKTDVSSFKSLITLPEIAFMLTSNHSHVLLSSCL